MSKREVITRRKHPPTHVSISFKCHMCGDRFVTDEKKRIHLLFAHNFFAPQCENYDMINNRVVAENNLVNDYMALVNSITYRVTNSYGCAGFRHSVDVEEFYKLWILEIKLKRYNIKPRTYNDTVTITFQFIKDMYRNEHGGNIRDDYKWGKDKRVIYHDAIQRSTIEQLVKLTKIYSGVVCHGDIHIPNLPVRMKARKEERKYIS